MDTESQQAQPYKGQHLRRSLEANASGYTGGKLTETCGRAELHSASGTTAATPVVGNTTAILGSAGPPKATHPPAPAAQ